MERNLESMTASSSATYRKEPPWRAALRARLWVGLAMMATALMSCDGATPASNTSSLVAPLFDDSTPRFAPDGSAIVFVRSTGDDSDIMFLELPDGVPSVLADLSEFDLDPAFSPDGQSVVFDSSPDGFPQLHLIDVAGGKAEAISDVQDGWATYPAWSPDGDLIVYSCGRPSYDSSDICFLPVAGGGSSSIGPPSESQELEPSWSPDGSTIAFSSNESGDAELYAYDIEHGSITRLTTASTHDGDPAWSPDGSKIAFTSNPGGLPQVCILDVVSGDSQCITEGVQPSWSGDGQRLVFYRDTSSGTRVFTVEADGFTAQQIT